MGNRSVLVLLAILFAVSHAAHAASTTVLATGDEIPGVGIVGQPASAAIVGFVEDGALVLHAKRSDGSEGLFAAAADGSWREWLVFGPASEEKIDPENIAVAESGYLLVPTREWRSGPHDRIYRADANGAQLLAETGDEMPDGSQLCSIEGRPRLTLQGDVLLVAGTQPADETCDRYGDRSLLTISEGQLVRMPVVKDANGKIESPQAPTIGEIGFVVQSDRAFYHLSTQETRELFRLDDLASLLPPGLFDSGSVRTRETAFNDKGDVALLLRANYEKGSTLELFDSRFEEPAILAVWRDGALEVRALYAHGDTSFAALSINRHGDVLLHDSYFRSVYSPLGLPPLEAVGFTGALGANGEIASNPLSKDGALSVAVRDRDGQITERHLESGMAGPYFAVDGIRAACVSDDGLAAAAVTRTDGKRGIVCIDDDGVHPVVEEGTAAAYDRPVLGIETCRFAPDGSLLFSASELFWSQLHPACYRSSRAIFRVTDTGVERVVGRGDRTTTGAELFGLDDGSFSVDADGTIRFRDGHRDGTRHPDGRIERPAGWEEPRPFSSCGYLPTERFFVRPLEMLPDATPTPYVEDNEPSARRARHHSGWTGRKIEAGEFTLTETSTRGHQSLALAGPPRRAHCNFATPAAEYPTKTATPTPTRTRRSTSTPQPTSTPRPTFTATPDPCATPGACPELKLRSERSAIGYTVSVGLDAAGRELSGLQADLLLPGIDPALPNAVTCKINPFVGKPLRYHMQSDRVLCGTERCAVMRVVVVATQGSEPFPATDTLLTCRLRLPEGAGLRDSTVQAIRGIAATATGARVELPPSRSRIAARGR